MNSFVFALSILVFSVVNISDSNTLNVTYILSHIHSHCSVRKIFFLVFFVGVISPFHHQKDPWSHFTRKFNISLIVQVHFVPYWMEHVNELPKIIAWFHFKFFLLLSFCYCASNAKAIHLHIFIPSDIFQLYIISFICARIKMILFYCVLWRYVYRILCLCAWNQ